MLKGVVKLLLISEVNIFSVVMVVQRYFRLIRTEVGAIILVVMLHDRVHVKEMARSLKGDVD